MIKKSLLTMAFLMLGVVQAQAVRLGDANQKTSRDRGTNIYDSEGVFRYGIGVNYFRMTPFKDDQFEGANGVSASLMMEMSGSYGAELSVGQYSQNVKSGDKLGKGSSSLMPIMVTLLYTMRVDQQVSPYFGVGGGWISVNHTPDDSVKNQYQYLGLVYNETIDSDFEYHGVVGLNIFLSRERHVAFNIDYRYVYFAPAINYQFNLSGTTYSFADSVQMGGHMLNGGLSYYF